ncbi:MAG: hypothetical protein JWO91_623 [Acidobacteriaceae bacterium]|nr:hypothetical protein [Acidobacteriaceae bacterium]
MTPQHPSDWERLAQQVSNEMDPRKLLVLVTELNRVLGERNEMSRQQRQHQPKSYRNCQ